MASEYEEPQDSSAESDSVEPCEKRWDPLGACDLDNDLESYHFEYDGQTGSKECQCMSEKVRALEEEQELLNVSLFQLTSHFAQVQFRLRQVCEAPLSEKEQLLKALEQFAFCGVNAPPTEAVESPVPTSSNISIEHSFEDRTQLQLIEQLTNQLKELQALVSSSNFKLNEPNSKVMLEQQKQLVDELKNKLKYEENGNLSTCVINTLNPYNNMKEQIVSQFKTQIADLERFVQLLQGTEQCSSCTTPSTASGSKSHPEKLPSVFSSQSLKADEIRSRTVNIFRKVSTLLHIFITMQFGCGGDHFKMNDLKEAVNHWGDLRARLEVAVVRIEDLFKSSEGQYDGAYLSDNEDGSSVKCKSKVTEAVRKYLAPSIRDLLQHGLIETNETTSVVPFMCFPIGMGSEPRAMHAWHLLVQYYRVASDHATSDMSPACQLSHSFNLDVVGRAKLTNKQSLLNTIGNIMYTHERYKRSYDSQFKAFVCDALNENKLVIWLSLILQCKQLINRHYQPWSYTVRTGFQDSLQSLGRLTAHKFNLPTDLAIRHFQNIRDAFL